MKPIQTSPHTPSTDQPFSPSEMQTSPTSLEENNQPIHDLPSEANAASPSGPPDQLFNPFRSGVIAFAKLRGEQWAWDENCARLVSTSTGEFGLMDFIQALLIDVIAGQIYHALMLHLPGLYWIRISRLFGDAEKSLVDVALLLAESHPDDPDIPSLMGHPPTPANLGRSRPIRKNTTVSLANLQDEPVSYKKMKDSWNLFIEALLNEWASFNILTVLLLSAIVAILQIDAAAQDIIVRTAAFLSLIFALLSLVYGCIFTGRFHEMRKPYKGAYWARQVADIRGTNLFWNAWVFLAMPAVWLAWSLISFLLCILAFIWRTGDPILDPPKPYTKGELFACRVMTTTVLVVGCIYLLLSWFKFREYEAMYQKSTQDIIKKWSQDHIPESKAVNHGRRPTDSKPLGPSVRRPKTC